MPDLNYTCSLLQHQLIRKNHILVIDDDQDILDSVQLLLTREGYRVQISLNGANRRPLESDPPDLILLDVCLVGEDGRALCRQVKEWEPIKHIPVMLFSAHTAARRVIHTCQADGFRAKPFGLRDLLTLMKGALQPHYDRVARPFSPEVRIQKGTIQHGIRDRDTRELVGLRVLHKQNILDETFCCSRRKGRS